MGEMVLCGGHIVNATGVAKADLWIVDGRIAGVLESGVGELIGRRGDHVRLVAAEGLYILPGLIDVHVHLREPGLEHKEDLVSGTSAAACGGVTTVLDMPNTDPVVANARILRDKMARAAGRIHVDTGFYGVVGENNQADIQEMANEGAVAFKLFLGPTTGDIRAPEIGPLVDAFREVASTGLPLVVHAEDRAVIEYWQSRMQAEGDSYGHFLRSRPSYGEAAATDLAIRLAEETGVQLHIAHIATEEGLTAFEAARQRSDAITGETCPHYLALTESDWPQLGNKLKILPPVRSLQDQRAIWKAVQSGLIDVIATDHAPHLLAERAGKNLWEAPAGAAGLETLLPLLLNWVNQGHLTLPDVVRLTSTRPAQIFGLHSKGEIRPGAQADLVLVDMTRRMVIEGRHMHSRCKNTPFEGWEVQGVPVATYLAGEQIASEGQLVQPDRPLGKVLGAE